MEQVLTDTTGTTVYYAVKVAGRIVSQKYTSQTMAEQAKEQLPEDTKQLAEIAIVTSDNLELLLG